jgi:hypothetical protein
MVSASSKPVSDVRAAVAGVEHRAIDLFRDQPHRARTAWRITMASARMAFSVIAVSISVSPFLTLDCATCMLTTSAPSRFPAISNDSSVRVEFSKKALMMVSPPAGRRALRTRAVERDPLFGLFQNVEYFPFLKSGNAQQMPVRKSVPNQLESGRRRYSVTMSLKRSALRGKAVA